MTSTREEMKLIAAGLAKFLEEEKERLGKVRWFNRGLKLDAQLTKKGKGKDEMYKEIEKELSYIQQVLVASESKEPVRHSVSQPSSYGAGVLTSPPSSQPYAPHARDGEAKVVTVDPMMVTKELANLIKRTAIIANHKRYSTTSAVLRVIMSPLIYITFGWFSPYEKADSMKKFEKFIDGLFSGSDKGPKSPAKGTSGAGISGALSSSSSSSRPSTSIPPSSSSSSSSSSVPPSTVTATTTSKRSEFFNTFFVGVLSKKGRVVSSIGGKDIDTFEELRVRSAGGPGGPGGSLSL